MAYGDWCCCPCCCCCCCVCWPCCCCCCCCGFRAVWTGTVTWDTTCCGCCCVACCCCCSGCCDACAVCCVRCAAMLCAVLATAWACEPLTGRCCVISSLVPCAAAATCGLIGCPAALLWVGLRATWKRFYFVKGTSCMCVKTFLPACRLTNLQGHCFSRVAKYLGGFWQTWKIDNQKSLKSFCSEALQLLSRTRSWRNQTAMGKIDVEATHLPTFRISNLTRAKDCGWKTLGPKKKNPQNNKTRTQTTSKHTKQQQSTYTIKNKTTIAKHTHTKLQSWSKVLGRYQLPPSPETMLEYQLHTARDDHQLTPTLIRERGHHSYPQC